MSMMYYRLPLLNLHHDIFAVLYLSFPESETDHSELINHENDKNK